MFHPTPFFDVTGCVGYDGSSLHTRSFIFMTVNTRTTRQILKESWEGASPSGPTDTTHMTDDSII